MSRDRILSEMRRFEQNFLAEAPPARLFPLIRSSFVNNLINYVDAERFYALPNEIKTACYDAVFVQHYSRPRFRNAPAGVEERITFDLALVRLSESLNVSQRARLAASASSVGRDGCAWCGHD